MLPSASAPSVTRRTTDAFPGLDCRPRPVDGACAAMVNLCGADYPVLSQRPGRGLLTTLSSPGGLLCKDALCWVDGASFYINGYAVDLGLAPGKKQLLSMGAYAVIFPDKKYVNTKDLSDFGSLEASFSASGAVRFALCDRQGNSLSYASAPPAEPREGDRYLDGTVLYVYTASGWTEEADVHVRLDAAGIGAPFAPGDGVTLSGTEDLDGLRVLTDVGDGFLLFPGVTGQTTAASGVTVSREVPDLDFLCECGNRLWGCKYGIVDGETVNEIYACKLGDFKNWNAFSGLSTDAYRASRGADGPFTGAVAFQGSPIFFRETCLERVYPDAAGAHRIALTQAPGVLSGCEKSLTVVNGVLYYLSPGGVAAYDGALPQIVSGRLGKCSLEEAVGGALGGDYYLSAKDGGSRRLLVYDTYRGNWYEQDDPGLTDLAAGSFELYGLTEDGRVLSMTGVEGEGEEPVAFSLETGDLGLDIPEWKTVSRLRLRCRLGGSLQVELQYDSDGVWRPAGRVQSLGLRSLTLPILPRRCDHLRLRLTGEGAFQLFSLSRILEKGSDMP